MSKEIIQVPDLGGADDVEVVEILVAVGDDISAEQELVVLESDKASMEIPSPKAGKVLAISIKEGDKLNEGDAIIELEVAAVAGELSTPAVEVSEPKAKAPEAEPEKAPEQAATVTAEQEIRVPDLGGGGDVEVIEILVAVGDVISEEQELIVLESDKASMEIPSPAAGKIVSISAKLGDTVNEGDLILVIATEQQATDVSAPASLPSADKVYSAPAPAIVQQTHEEDRLVDRISEARPSNNVYAGPAVRKLARELGIDLALVVGSGPKARIQKQDLHDFVKSLVKGKAKSVASSLSSGTGIPAIPDIDFSKFGEVRAEPLSKLHKVTAANMQRSWLNVPHVTQFDDADITDLEEFRKTLKAEGEKRGVKITPLPFILKAVAAALRQNPKFNASLSADGENMIFKDYVHIGMAVDTPAGLMVPVIRDVDKKSVWELAAETVELATKAKDRKLKPAEMQGGCFTISSLGGIGGTGFTPIVNAPEVGILGISKLAIKPVWDGSEFKPRKMLPLCLSYDHRAVNGADAGRFMTELGQLLADIRRLAL